LYVWRVLGGEARLIRIVSVNTSASYRQYVLVKSTPPRIFHVAYLDSILRRYRSAPYHIERLLPV